MVAFDICRSRAQLQLYVFALWSSIHFKWRLKSTISASFYILLSKFFVLSSFRWLWQFFVCYFCIIFMTLTRYSDFIINVLSYIYVWTPVWRNPKNVRVSQSYKNSRKPTKLCYVYRVFPYSVVAYAMVTLLLQLCCRWFYVNPVNT